MKHLGVIGFVLVTICMSSQVSAESATNTTDQTTASPPVVEMATESGIGGDTDRLTAAVVSDVQTKISQDPTFTGADITVTSEHGVFIVLNGTVDTQAQADAAISSAKSIPGVAGVKSNLTIRGSSATTNGSTTTTTTSTTSTAPTY